ncbi:MAG: hypothetical protein FWG83_04695 [Oscillospiraceae bacterium]|nr:hypothetical protein [Oscillospiraceae bacterium]
MNISQIVNNSINSQSNNLPKTASQKTQEKSSTLAAENVDKFDKDSVNVNRNYQSSPDKAEFLAVQGYKGKSSLQIKNALIADYVNAAITGQAGNDFLGMIFKPRAFALEAFKAAEATSEKYDDYWGVEAVAERIFTFAKTLAGDRDDLFDLMKNSFLKGFNLASGAVKGRLPDISQKTKERVLEYFDAWEAEINARKNPPPAETETETE